MKTFDLYVKCLAVMDERQSAWNTSRPELKEGDVPFDKVAEMDLSLNSMKVYTLEIRSSVFFRDLLFSLRPIQGWAQSTRSAPLNAVTLRLSSEYSHLNADYKRIQLMLNRINNGASIDQVRDLLTISVSTVYTIAIDNRVLIGFLKSLKGLNPDLFHIYGRLILDEIGHHDFERLMVSPSHIFSSITQNESLLERTEHAGDMIFGYYNMKYAMAAQFLRQHYSKIKIGLWDLVPNYFHISMSQSDKIPVVFYIDSAAYSSLMQKRLHWAADWSMDMWGAMLSDYIANMSTLEFWEFIPAGNGKKDPYLADIYNRVLNKAPGLPCPILCEWPDMISRKQVEVGDSLVIQKYKDLVTEGYIKDNPNNEHRMKYIELGGKA